MTQDVPQGFAAAAADFEAMARRFWGAWADAMRQVPNPGVPPQASAPFGAAGFGTSGAFGASGMGMPGGGYGAAADPSAWWAQYVQGPAAAQDAAGRFDALARHWYAQMQQLAAHFAGRDNSAADVTEAWRQLLQAGGGNPFAQLFAMAQRQPGSFGPDAWMGQAAPWLQSLQMLRGQAHDWLQMPAFGVAREHQARWQGLASAQIALQEKLEAYSALMGRVLEDALQRFERKLAEREAPGLGIDTPRALFDLWIDAAEEAYAPVALGPEFRRIYGELVDAQMRVRQSVQREVEQACALFDMPTRTELDGAHRKIVELERQVRRLRDAVARMPGAVQAATPANTGAKPARKASRARAEHASPRKGPRRGDGGRTPQKPADAPRGSRVAAQDGGAQAAPATRTRAATKTKKAGGARRRDAQAAGRPTGERPRATASKTPKSAPAQRAARKAATSPTRRAQPVLFSSAEAMPAAPQPLKTGKGKR